MKNSQIEISGERKGVSGKCCESGSGFIFSSGFKQTLGIYPECSQSEFDLLAAAVIARLSLSDSVWFKSAHSKAGCVVTFGNL